MDFHDGKNEIRESAVGLLNLDPLCSRRRVLKMGGISIIGISALGPVLAQGATEAYAKILSLKRGGSRRLIAEIVRQNSAYYPRPVPLDTFTQPPFNLTSQEVRNDLEKMQAEEEYLYIVSTTTSSPRVFLYSTLHLETDHAEMLAEWLDVGQFDNP